MKKLICVLLIVAMLCVLCACGGKGNDLVGTWSYSEEEDGITAVVSFTFTKDGKLVYKMGVEDLPEEYAAYADMFNQEMEGTYTVDGNTITTVMNGESSTNTYKISGNKLTMIDGDKEVVLTKSK